MAPKFGLKESEKQTYEYDDPNSGAATATEQAATPSHSWYPDAEIDINSDMMNYAGGIAKDRVAPSGQRQLTSDMHASRLAAKGSGTDALFRALGVDNPYDAATASKEKWRRALQNDPWLLSLYGDDEYGDLLGVTYDQNGNPIWDENKFNNWYDTLTGKYTIGNMFDDPDTYEYILRSEYGLPTLAAYGDRLAEFFSNQGIGGDMFGTDDWFYTLDENGQPIANQSNMDIARSGLNQLFLRNFLAANADDQDRLEGLSDELKWLLGGEGTYAMSNIPKLTWKTASDIKSGGSSKYSQYGYDWSGKDYDYTDYEPELGYTNMDLEGGMYMEDLPWLLDFYLGQVGHDWAGPGLITTVAPRYGKD